ncbi:hypothetical protein GH733_019507 [Mirounga leonina]|nr:hypothetical protein GH733_019507 [Mirounga leonina]
MKNPQKPQYSMDVEFSLALYDFKFENIKWIYDWESQDFNTKSAVKIHMCCILQRLDSVAIPKRTFAGPKMDGVTDGPLSQSRPVPL